ncbi:uncharacterized protein EV422DRAFT_565236 [Fimicolochytrium jonesii]|uniref:uncharacterized protein n=1 Tax=Fimicolochytrium jonesii TaxID=1396493 RepID=UPI0022FEC5D9|nr:uncharacterized protein EV422DRAFT_565236 [Fimicolochytrium jonesii]KAI8824545.1 hypothetical protein EV422DRAFT_565236 [Fimicolochytrium jonesii]
MVPTNPKIRAWHQSYNERQDRLEALIAEDKKGITANKRAITVNRKRITANKNQIAAHTERIVNLQQGQVELAACVEALERRGPSEAAVSNPVPTRPTVAMRPAELVNHFCHAEDHFRNAIRDYWDMKIRNNKYRSFTGRFETDILPRLAFQRQNDVMRIILAEFLHSPVENGIVPPENYNAYFNYLTRNLRVKRVASRKGSGRNSHLYFYRPVFEEMEEGQVF